MADKNDHMAKDIQFWGKQAGLSQTDINKTINNYVSSASQTAQGPSTSTGGTTGPTPTATSSQPSGRHASYSVNHSKMQQAAGAQATANAASTKAPDRATGVVYSEATRNALKNNENAYLDGRIPKKEYETNTTNILKQEAAKTANVKTTSGETKSVPTVGAQKAQEFLNKKEAQARANAEASQKEYANAQTEARARALQQAISDGAQPNDRNLAQQAAQQKEAVNTTVLGKVNEEHGEIYLRSTPGKYDDATPNDPYDNIKETYGKGASYEIIGEAKDKAGDVWYKVRMEDGQEGYIGKDVYDHSTITSTQAPGTTSAAGERQAKAGYDTTQAPGTTSAAGERQAKAGYDTTQGPNTYTVQSGDTLSSIAKGNTGKDAVKSVGALAILNGIADPNIINTGQELTLTANKDAVDSCSSNLGSWITSMSTAKTVINTNINRIEECLSTIGTGYDGALAELKNTMDTNYNAILEDANAFKSWLQELSDALGEEASYTDSTAGGITTSTVSEI